MRNVSISLVFSLFVIHGFVQGQSLVYAPSSLTFPATPLNVSSAEQIVKITNTGSAAAVFSDYIVPSNYSIDYKPATSVTTACGPQTDAAPNLAPGASCAIGITYNPTSKTPAAPFGNNLSIDLCPPCQGVFYNLPLNASTGNGPVLKFSPAQLTFPATPAGGASADIQVTVTNVGNATAAISSLPSSSVFALGANNCLPSIAAGASCSMLFNFLPPANATVGSVLSADSTNATPNALILATQGGTTFSLNATGTVAAAAPAITLSPASVSIAAQAGGSDVQGPSITVTNTSKSAVTITTIGSSDSAHIIYDKAGNCETLQPNGTCTFDIYFRPPASPTTVNGTIMVSYTSSGGNGQATATFMGTATAGPPPLPAVSIDASTLVMYAPVGGVSPVATATVTNTGTANLVFGTPAVVIKDTTLGFSKVNDTCTGATLSPNGTCHLDFTYTAVGGGQEQTTATLADNASPSTQTITLRGSASGALLTIMDNNVILASPGTTTLTFDAIVNKTTASATMTLISSGNQPVTIQNIQIRDNENGFVLGDLTSCIRTLNGSVNGQPGDQCSFTVTFNPTGSDGAYNNQLNITASPMGAIPIPLQGIAVYATPPAVQFQTSIVNEQSTPCLYEPVDGATGQYYEDEIDFDLGGPLHFQFGRYYGSSLSVGGYNSEMGANWMNNFDSSVAINGSNAQVMMFRGKIVNFTKANGAWTLAAAPANIVYQFSDTPTGFQFMSPVSNTIYTYDKGGRLVGISDLRGNTLTIVQGPSGPVSISDGLGRSLSLNYNNGLLSSIADQSGRTVQYSYSNGLLTSATDATMAATQYKYTTVGTFTGLMTQKILPNGNAPTTQTYDITGKVIAQTDPDGNTKTIAYDGKGGVSVTSPLGTVSRQANNTLGEIGTLTDPAGNSSTLTYDNFGRRMTVTNRNGNSVKFTYHDPSGDIASRTDELGNTTSYAYSPLPLSGFTLYRIAGITYSDGAQDAMAYDAKGNVISRTTADGAVQSFTYDDKNQLVSSTDANQQTTKYSYGLDGIMASKIDPMGNTWTFASTASGLPAKISDPNGGASSITYDPDNRPLSVTDAAGGMVAYQYDANGQTTAVTNQDGGVTRMAYTAAGRLASVTDAFGNQTGYAYDPQGRLLSVTDAAGETVSRTYDSANHLTKISDNNGARIIYAWDNEDHAVSQTDPTGRTVQFGYDAVGRLTSSTKPDGSQYTFGYDKRGRLISLTNPLGETQSMTRDIMGRVSGVTLPGGISSSIQFDARGVATAITGPNGNTWSFTRDPLGRISAITDPLGNASNRTYTGTWLTGITTPLGSVTIARDPDGRVTQRQYSDGVTYNAAWDPMGLLISADGVSVQRDAMGHAININGMAVTYTSAGRLAGITYAPGKTITYSYDSAGRLSTIADWVGGQTTIAYDAASRVSGISYPNGIATSYTLDANGRLSGITAGSIGSISLTRDADGKIASEDRELPSAPTLEAQSQQYTYNAGSQLTGENYDAMGRALTQNGRTYTWNLASQLTGFQDNMNSGSLTYDGLGELASSNVTGATQNFVFNYGMKLPALSIVRSGGADLRYYVYTPGGRLLYSIEAADNSRKFYHFDEMGNTMFLTGDDGSVTDTYAITPYGDVVDHVGPEENPFTWQGQYGVIQEAPGLYFMRARHYDASAGRFLSPDPLITPDPRSAEPYVYARSNPMQYNDPSGAISRAEVAAAEVALGGLDDKIPTVGLVSLLVLTGLHLGPYGTQYSTADIMQLIGLVAANPELTWWQLGDLADDNSNVVKLVPPSNENGVAHCIMTNTCSPTVLGSLNSDIATGSGGVPELPAASIVAAGGGNLVGGAVISNDGGSVISNDGGSVVSNDGGSIVAAGGGNVINKGAALIGQDGSGLIGQDGSGLTKGAGSN